jgi:DNA-binding ferritin-like protein
LERKVKEKDENIQEIVAGYESVMQNFHDVIQKLVEERANDQNILLDGLLQSRDNHAKGPAERFGFK